MHTNRESHPPQVNAEATARLATLRQRFRSSRQETQRLRRRVRALEDDLHRAHAELLDTRVQLRRRTRKLARKRRELRGLRRRRSWRILEEISRTRTHPQRIFLLPFRVLAILLRPSGPARPDGTTPDGSESASTDEPGIVNPARSKTAPARESRKVQGLHLGQVIPVDDWSDDEVEAARTYWASIPARADCESAPHWSIWMADQILAFEPKSVLEFGFNLGPTLRVLRHRDLDIKSVGIDSNAEIENWDCPGVDLDLRKGGEANLKAFNDNAVDVAFTVATLHRLADPRQALTELIRIARYGVVILEPTLKDEGKIVSYYDSYLGDLATAPPYRYSWFYDSLIKSIEPKLQVDQAQYPLEGVLAGSFYRMYTVSDPTTVQMLLPSPVPQELLDDIPVQDSCADSEIDAVASNFSDVYHPHRVALPQLSLSPSVAEVRRQFQTQYRGTAPALLRMTDYKRWSYVLDQIKNRGDRLLDIGIGAGQFVSAAVKSDGFRTVIGLDIRPHSKLIANDGTQYVWASGSRLPFSASSFDVVTCMEVLEHLATDTLTWTLRELRRVCAGTLIIAVPWKEPEPLPRHHKQRFDETRVRQLFPDSRLSILETLDAEPPWVLLEEDTSVLHSDRV